VSPEPGFIPFNRAYVTGAEFDYMREAIENAHLAGSGPFSRRCREWLEQAIGSRRVLLTHSCTGALEMSFTLAEIGPGDEVVMPSFSFVTAATAVVARGGTPVFVDVRPDTLCIDAELVARALSDQAKAVVPVHYAGVGCEMDGILELARAHDLVVVEDAAHGIGATAHGRPLGGTGELGTLSFHETKNVSCGEGGALLVNDEHFVERAEVVHEKGTDRQRFFRGQVDKYTWVDVGSSYVLSDLAAAYLWAQLERVEEITAMRHAIWESYHAALGSLEQEGQLRRPVVPEWCSHNAHTYYVLLEDSATRAALIEHLAERGISAVFHYVPLHSSPAGLRYGRASGDFSVTSSVSERLLRLPLWAGMSADEIDRVVDAVQTFFGGLHARPTRSVRTTSPG
jgi:dTDP-4-amino-4,6-dideoxygalactose transaminase